MLTQICCSKKDYPLHNDESFIFHQCFPFSLTGEREIAEQVLMSCTAYTYYVTLMATEMHEHIHRVNSTICDGKEFFQSFVAVGMNENKWQLLI